MARIAHCLAVFLLLSGSAEGVTPLVSIDASPDVTAALGNATVEDAEIALDALQDPIAEGGFPGLPRSVDVIALARLPGGDTLLAFDTVVVLPDGIGTFTARRGDVVRLQGTTYTLEFDAAAAGVRAGAMTDAISTLGSDLLLSFDATVDLGGGLVANDEDLVRWDGIAFTMLVDGSAFGVLRGLDLDAAHHVGPNGHLLLSFDASGAFGGVTFTDEDVLELDPVAGTWELAYDASTRDSGWTATDLDSVAASTDVDDDGLPDATEQALGTDPLDADSDDDGLTDGEEVNVHQTLPLDPDTDGDTFSDGFEIAAGSDPLDPDSIPDTPMVPALSAGGRILLGILLLAGGWALRRRGN